jgi:hypothetical protein
MDITAPRAAAALEAYTVNALTWGCSKLDDWKLDRYAISDHVGNYVRRHVGRLGFQLWIRPTWVLGTHCWTI